MKLISYLNEKDIFWVYLMTPKRDLNNITIKDLKVLKKDMMRLSMTTNGIPVRPSFKMSSVKSDKGKETLRKLNINTEEDYRMALKQSHKKTSPFIAIDTTKVQIMDIDSKEIAIKSKNLKQYHPYFKSITKRLPHYFCYYECDRVVDKSIKDVDFLCGQWSLAVSNSKIYNSNSNIQKDVLNPSLMKEAYGCEMIVQKPKNKNIVPAIKSSLPIKLLQKSIYYLAQTGNHYKTFDEWWMLGSFVKHHLGENQKEFFQLVSRQIVGYESKIVTDQEWKGFPFCNVEDTFLKNLLKKYPKDKKIQKCLRKMEALLMPDFLSDSDDEVEEEIVETKAPYCIKLNIDDSWYVQIKQLKEIIDYRKMQKELKEAGDFKEEYVKHITKVKELIKSIIQQQVVMVAGRSKPSYYTLYSNEFDRVAEYKQMDKKNVKDFIYRIGGCRTIKLDQPNMGKIMKFNPLNDLIDDSELMLYNRTDCIPCVRLEFDEDSLVNVLNLWSGWKVGEEIEKFQIDYDLIKDIIWFFENIMYNDKYNNCEGLNHYMRCWIKRLFLGHKIESYIYNYGPQGLGKSMFWSDFIVDCMLGDKCGITFADPKTFFKTFNEFNRGKSLIVFDETGEHSCDNSTWHLFKNMVTSKKQNINQKFQDLSTESDFRNFVGNGNSRDVYNIEGMGDRRGVSTATNPIMKGNFAFFTKMINQFKNPMIQLHFFHWILETDDSEFNAGKIPRTKERVRAEMNYTPYIMRWVMWFFYQHKNIKETIKYNMNEILASYNYYRSNSEYGSGAKSMSPSSKFGKKLYALEPPIGDTLKGLRRNNGKKVYWKINPIDVKNILSELKKRFNFHNGDKELEFSTDCMGIMGIM